MKKRPCPRTLDRPIVALWGLEPLDLGAVLGTAAVLFLMTNIGVALAGAVAAALGLRALKAGRPRGYVFGVFYRSGLLRAVPRSLRPPGLVRPPGLGRRSVSFSAVPGPEDDDTPEAKFFRGSTTYVR
jgi:hypothetical protein